MIRLLISGFCLLMMCCVAFGQTKNQRDPAGRKQGFWEAVDSKGGLVYTGYFRDDKPVGEMKRYYPTGEVRVIMRYDNKNSRVRARFFWQNGELAARGNYIGTKRDSVWLYYSYYTKTLSHRAEYTAGARNGKTQSFYPDGKVAEETIWTNDQKNGPWKQFFESGQLKSSASYKNDKLEGTYVANYPDGKKEAEGVYRSNQPDGDWKHYGIDGKVASTIKYKEGAILNLDDVEASEREFFKKVDAQKDRIKEPTLEDLMREAQSAGK